VYIADFKLLLLDVLETIMNNTTTRCTQLYNKIQKNVKISFTRTDVVLLIVYRQQV